PHFMHLKVKSRRPGPTAGRLAQRLQPLVELLLGVVVGRRTDPRPLHDAVFQVDFDRDAVDAEPAREAEPFVEVELERELRFRPGQRLLALAERDDAVEAHVAPLAHDRAQELALLAARLAGRSHRDEDDLAPLQLLSVYLRAVDIDETALGQ